MVQLSYMFNKSIVFLHFLWFEINLRLLLLIWDGLFLVTNSLDLVSGYPLAVLTPNVNEYKSLVQKVLSCEVNDRDAPEFVTISCEEVNISLKFLEIVLEKFFLRHWVIMYDSANISANKGMNFK
ncbi:hypothetical protein Ddye_006564 [Dipteronia dyeriana]|uniref:Uncharacterized protein n=1 Tax=Dipteronia dyeriana TaxID=168575 RepID=A0AAD9XI77_9ROSI|nr:hypothetical protein Ddye_006564 [Dipteronia dyeriana]